MLLVISTVCQWKLISRLNALHLWGNYQLSGSCYTDHNNPCHNPRRAGEKMGNISRGVLKFLMTTHGKKISSSIRWMRLLGEKSSRQWQIEIYERWRTPMKRGNTVLLITFEMVAVAYVRAGLTVQRWVDVGSQAEGSFPFTVEGLDLDLELGQRSEGGIFMDVVLGLGFGQRHFPPLQLARLLEGHNVAKVGPIVILWLHRLWTEKQTVRYPRSPAFPTSGLRVTWVCWSLS